MPEKLFPTTRLEAFSDGVLAVIITIMVLDLRVPYESGLRGIFSLVPPLFIYLLSFAFTAIYWVNHHHLIDRVKQCDHRVLYANMGFLFSISLLPFFTKYVLEKDADSFSVTLYAASMIVTGGSFLLLRLAIRRLLQANHEFDTKDLATQRKHLVSLTLYIVSIPLAHFHPHIALGIITVITIIWITPTAYAEPWKGRRRHPGHGSHSHNG